MENFSYYSYDNNSVLALLPDRPAESNKGTFGRVLCVCGSQGMSGAAYFAAKAAYRMGAGLVEILTPLSERQILQTLIPEAIVTAYDPKDIVPSVINEARKRADAIVLGCGLGASTASVRIVEKLLCTDKPCVVDADGLNIISKNTSLLCMLNGKIITPHPMEMSRLTSLSVDEILSDTAQAAYSFSQQYGCICVLKSHNTVVSDGSEKLYKSDLANSALATGGSGDVLAGIIGGILAQMKASPDKKLAAVLGVHIHSLCGADAAQRLGERSVMASDIIESIPRVLTRA